jgi:hypothetical protein
MRPAAARPYGQAMPEDPPVQAWTLSIDGRIHRVEVRGSFSRRLRWYVDDDLVAEHTTSEDKVRLSPDGRPELGIIGIRFSGLGSPRRATLFEPDETGELDPMARAIAGLGGIDLVPAAGSPAAAHEEKVRAHPRRFAAVLALAGVAKVVVPIAVAALAARFAFALPLPDWDLPSIPWPDLPSIPWPDLPSIPWPDWSMPGWLAWLLDKAKYAWPLVLAYVLARGEIRRRKQQDELRASRPGERRAENEE